MKPPIEWRPDRDGKGQRKPVQAKRFEVTGPVSVRPVRVTLTPGVIEDAVGELERRRALKAAQMRRYRARRGGKIPNAE